MDPEMDMFLNHPGMLAQNEARTEFSGLIFIHHQAVSMTLKLNQTTSGYVGAAPNEGDKHESFISTLNDKLIQHPAHYLNNLVACLRERYPPHAPVPTQIYRRVLHEYQEFVNFYIYLEDSQLSPGFTTVSVTYADGKLRMHRVTIKVNYDSSVDGLFTLAECDLPVTVQGADDSLINLFQMIVGTIESFQHFFDTMDHIDAICWVLDPSPAPKRAHCHRRIVIGEQLSALVTFSPQHPTSLPNIKLLGPPRKVLAMTASLQGNYASWDDCDDILEALLKMFALDEFPKKDKSAAEFGVGTCCICFSMWSDVEKTGKLAEIFCPNEMCNQPFHTGCLYKWLQQTFQNCETRVRGNCPYCKTTISYDPLN